MIEDTQELLNTYPRISGNAQISFSAQAAKILAKAEKEAASLKDEYLSTEHIFIAVAESDSRCGELLKKNGVTKNAILSALNPH